MASRIAHHTTIKALSMAKNGFGTLDEVAARFHFEVSKGTLSRVLNGQSVSEYAENDIRLKLGLDAIRTKVAVACSTCGDVHGEGVDCHGKPVARVVIVSGKPRNRKRYLFLRFDPDEGDIRTACAALRDSLRVALAFEEETRT